MTLTLKIGRWIAPLLIFSIIVFSVSLAPFYTHASQFSVVQSKSASGTSATPTITLASGATAGDLLVVCITDAGNQTSIPVNGTDFNNFTSQHGGSGGSSRSLYMYYEIATSGEKVITGVTNNNSWTIAVAEYSGVTASTVKGLPLDSFAGQLEASQTTTYTPHVNATTTTESLAVLCTMQKSGSTWSNEQFASSTTGVIEEQDIQNGTATAGVYADLIQTTTSGAQYASADGSSAAVGAAIIALFQANTAANNTSTTGQTKLALRNVKLYIRNVSLKIR